MTKTITLALGILAALVAVYALWAPHQYVSTQSEALSSGFEAFKKAFRDKDSDEAKLDKVVTELAAIGLLIGKRLLQLGRRNALFFQQQVANANRHRSDSEIGGAPVAHTARTETDFL